MKFLKIRPGFFELRILKMISGGKMEIALRNLSHIIKHRILIPKQIKETFNQLHSIKSQLNKNELLLDEKIKELKLTDSLYAPQKNNESETDYQKRTTTALAKLDELKKEYLSPLIDKLSELRNRKFETTQIIIKLGKYNPVKQIYPAKVELHYFMRKIYNIKITVEKEKAKEFSQSWHSLTKKAILSFDIGDKLNLSQIVLENPQTGFACSSAIQDYWHIPVKYINTVSFSPNGKYLAVGSNHYKAKVFSLDTRQLEMTFELEKVSLFDVELKKKLAINCVTFSSDGKLLAISGGNVNLGRIRVFDLSIKRSILEYEQGDKIHAIELSPDGRSLVLGTGHAIGGRALVLSLKTKKITQDFRHERAVKTIAFSPDGKFLVTGCENMSKGGITRVFDLETQTQIIEFEHERPVRLVSCSPNEKFLVTSSERPSLSSEIRIYDLVSKQVITKFEPDSTIFSMAISPDSSLLGIGGSKRALIYDLQNFQLLQEFDLYSRVNALAFSPDSKYIAVNDIIYRTH